MDSLEEFKTKTRYCKVIYLTFTAGFLLMTLGIAAAPLLAYASHPELSNYVYYAFSTSCHQLDERSLHIFGFKFAVCARCAGVYFGALISMLIYPKFKRIDDAKMPSYRIIALLATPLALDSLTQLLGFRESTNSLRLATGLLLGAAIPLYLLPLANRLAEAVLRSI